MPRNNLDVLCLLQEHGAIVEGHFEMPSGFHSQTYIQTSLLLQHPKLAQKIAGALSEKFTKKADVILALTPSDSVLAQEVARVRGVRAIFASKDDNGEMILKHNFTIKNKKFIIIQIFSHIFFRYYSWLYILIWPFSSVMIIITI